MDAHECEDFADVGKIIQHHVLPLHRTSPVYLLHVSLSLHSFIVEILQVFIPRGAVDEDIIKKTRILLRKTNRSTVFMSA